MWTLKPDDHDPIWKQIAAGILHQIATGALRPGDAAPSVRELARLLQVNPLTIQKAYRHLIDQGVLVVQRGAGTYVSAAPPEPSSAERAQKLAGAAERLVMAARTLRCDLTQTLEAVEVAWNESANPPEEPTP